MFSCNIHIIVIFSKGDVLLDEWNEISGKCFLHTAGAGIRSHDTKGGQFFLLLSAIV